jgi:hypothetical protein
MLTFGTIIVGWGVFIDNEIASLAREGARWASVHGAQWATDNNSGTATTAANVYTSGIQPHIAGIVISSGNVSVSWPDAGTQAVGNRVTVTVTYNWTPQLYVSALTLSGTSTMRIVY